MIFGMNHTAPTYARASLRRAARFTPTKIVTISITPSTHPSSVVCRGVNPNEDTIIDRWFVRLLGMLLIAEKSANSQVFGSLRAS